MKLEPFSPKQLATLTWWCDSSSYKQCDAIICDGAVRSGKTLCLSLSFVLWAFRRFEGQSFGICGKTIISLRRNVITPLLPVLADMGFECDCKISQNLLEIRAGGSFNRFYFFGGKDEGSAALIQGITLAGVLLDEVALMPRSFVEQALARCSVTGARFFFNCNPQHPRHWFYTQWIQKRGEKNSFYLHFTMEDNPSLSPDVRARYESLYSGAFHDRYVLGKWTAVHGAVYPMFDTVRHVFDQIPAECERWIISCDYGTVNPASFGLWGLHHGVWHRIREYYYDSRREGVSLTDEEYADALEALAEDLPIEVVIVDPAAAGFIQCLNRRGIYRVIAANNHVLEGIAQVTAGLTEGWLKFHSCCKDTLREFNLYRWNMDAPKDAPVKENDHAMDDIRYFAAYVGAQQGLAFHAVSTVRG